MKALGSLTDEDLKVLRQIDRASMRANFYRNFAEGVALFGAVVWASWPGPDGCVAANSSTVAGPLTVLAGWVAINLNRRSSWEPLIAKLIARDEDLKNELAWPNGIPDTASSDRQDSDHANR